MQSRQVRNKNRRIVKIINLILIAFMVTLIISAVLTVRWINDLKIMNKDALNTLNEINVRVTERNE